PHTPEQNSYPSPPRFQTSAAQTPNLAASVALHTASRVNTNRTPANFPSASPPALPTPAATRSPAALPRSSAQSHPALRKRLSFPGRSVRSIVGSPSRYPPVAS